MSSRDRIELGSSSARARRDAQREFGNVGLVKGDDECSLQAW
jgi:hypothetical protein